MRGAALLLALLGACAAPPPPGRISVEVYRGLGGEAAGSFVPEIELVLDATRSMAAPIAGSATRLEAARAKAAELLDALPRGSSARLHVLGAIDPAVECSILERHGPLVAAGDPALIEALASLPLGSEGSLGAALTALTRDLVSQGRARDARIVLFTDLESSCGGDLCAAAGELVSAGAWLDVVAIGSESPPDCLDALRPSAAQPGALVRALLRPVPAWRLTRPGAASGGAPVLADHASSSALQVGAGEWLVEVDLERPLVIGPLNVLPGRTTRVRVLDFPGGPARFSWEVVE
jgi:hypothetical protein